MKKITDWNEFIASESEKSYFQELQRSLLKRKNQQACILPPADSIYRAFELTPLDQIKVVILGQDPYHGVGQAHGLSFSVLSGQKIPPSLRNIFKEIANEYEHFTLPINGDLTAWAKQGVMLLNAILTVEEQSPGAHQKLGWQDFTDNAIRLINDQCEHVVFLLWGAFAQKKQSLIDGDKHLILSAPHPSPFSAHKGFFGCNHFQLANQYLIKKGKPSIDWACLSQ